MSKIRLNRLAATLLLSCGLLAGQTAYFPPDRFGETPKDSQFSIEWYSKHLLAMNEPSLFELSKDSQAHAYRFLWLRTFDPPVGVRVVIHADGSAEVITKVLSGQGGYEPGRLKKSTRRRLPKEYVKYELQEIIEGAQFWNLPTREDVDPNFVGLDGARWIMEGVKGGKYHVVDRWSPEGGRYKRLCTYFLIDLGRLRLLYEDVY